MAEAFLQTTTRTVNNKTHNLETRKQNLELGYHPEVILAGRLMNDSKGKHVASEDVNVILQSDLNVKGANILVLGIIFIENCSDVRNTKVGDVVKELQ